MKLLFCWYCNNIFTLTKRKRMCKCKQSWGKYTDDNHAEVHGKYAVPLGFNNHSLKFAISMRCHPILPTRREHLYEDGSGYIFDAWVYSKDNDVVTGGVDPDKYDYSEEDDE